MGRLKKGVAVLNVEIVIVYVVEEHIDPTQIICRDVKFLTEKALFLRFLHREPSRISTEGNLSRMPGRIPC